MLSRRTFLQASAATAALAGLPVKLNAASPAHDAEAWPENGTLLSDEGWSLWLDTKAAWANDDIFLPEDVAWRDGRLTGKGEPLPVNPPSGGWNALTPEAGKNVILPTSVEQHFWGKHGAGLNGEPRPYTPEEYRYAADTKNGTQPVQPPADDSVPQNGAYFGVSWWYRPIDIPAAMHGRQILLHIRGAHLRAEVYLNGQLCGYSIMEELPFEADLTHAAKPGGSNLLGIRITNPFGRFDWVDGSNAKWGKVALFRSHGFGALDRGITLRSAPLGVRIDDLWALNLPSAKTIEASVTLALHGDSQLHSGTVTFEVVDPASQKVLASVRGEERRDAMTLLSRRYSARIHCEAAEIWDLHSPRLYILRARLSGLPSEADERVVSFGFRSFAPAGIGALGSGTNAIFRLNGRRIRIYSSISWGFWGLNGMFPVPELAEKEVRAARKLGLNCLNFHRNLAKEDVLRWHDKLGVLRYMEPGGGKLSIGRLPANTQVNAAGIVMEKPTSEADKFAQRFMFVKCVEMVKAHRSHPSVIEYCLQNEIGADLKNPATLEVIEAMHREDPSRMVVLNDGFVQRGAAQAWFEPWNDEMKSGPLHRSDEEKYGAFWNNHQGAGDQWYDEFYQSPSKYTYQAPYKEILTEFGEMEGCARPDNHSLMVHQITGTFKRYGGDSYDLQDHREIVAGYERFLDAWGFRKAFPNAESVFAAVGRTCYESWMNYMENARISDELDFAAISGWESTAIENHSGIVDNLRNFKSDPNLIAGSLLPIRPIAKQRSACIERGQPATFDLYLANDTSHPATGTLRFSMVTPSGKLETLTSLPVPAQVPDQFSYLLKEGFITPPLTEQGLYRFRFAISSVPSATQTKEIWVTGVQGAVCKRSLRVAVSGVSPATRKQLAALGTTSCLEVLDFKPGDRYNLILSAGLTAKTSTEQSAGETTGETMPVMKPGHVPEPGEEPTTLQLGQLANGILDAVRSGTPLLAIPQSDTLSDGLAQQLAHAGAFQYRGAVGDLRAPWMGNWYFVREHPLYAGLPVNQAMGFFYQVKGRQANGVLVEGPGVEIVSAYSRDHDRKIGAGTVTCRLGKGKVVFHRCPDFHPVLQARFLANTIGWLVGTN
ncbi:MAG TPA: twin-arginine translocation signal domain-containing protein [Acidobacteriaceae bacterium]|jgi:hypothetical protein